MRSNEAAAYLRDLASPQQLVELLPAVFGGTDRPRRLRRFAERYKLRVVLISGIPHYSRRAIAEAIKTSPPRPPRRRRRPNAEDPLDQDHHGQSGTTNPQNSQSERDGADLASP